MGPGQPAISADEEAVKRNTDCVYFLASPLTCNKGNGCEYRHSEGARLNPRDCWYWLNGNCLNPKCSFRHPPLEDNLLGSHTSIDAVSKKPVNAPVHSSTKTVPCYYFQNGGCLKGARCLFMHGASPLTVPPKSSTGLVVTAHPEASNMSKNKPEAVAETGVDFFRPSREIVNGFKALSPLASDDQATQQPSNSVSHPYDDNQPHLVDEHTLDGREGDDSLRESSPGFDVLVEEHEDAGYFQDDEGIGMVDDIDYLHSSEYNTLPIFEGDEVYDRVPEFERYGQHVEYHQEGGLDTSDLRHKLLMQRKVNRPRSAVVAAPHRDEQPFQESDHSHRHRLRGRVKLPGSSSSDNCGSLSERGGERRRWDRSSSPSRRSRRHRQKVSKRESRGDEEEAGHLNFAGPKSLAELKSRRSSSVAESYPSVQGPKLLSTVLKRKRDEEEKEVIGQTFSCRPVNSSKLENGAAGVRENGGEEDCEKPYEEDNELDDEEGDDFSRKVGVMLA